MNLELLPNGNRKLVLRQSDFKTALTCSREFYLSVVRNLEPIRRGHSKADVGTFVHAGLEAYYKDSEDIPGAIAEAVAAAIEEDPFLEEDLTKDGVLATIMLQGYVDWLADEATDQGLTTLSIEGRLEAYVGTFQGVEVWVSGGIDRIVQDEHGQVWIHDHKTVDKFEEMPTFEINFQGQTYDFLVRANTDILPTGFIHNRLRRVKRTGTAKPPFYQRKEVSFNAAQRESHLWHLQGIAARVVAAIVSIEADDSRAQVHAAFPPLEGRDCSWRCDFVKTGGLCPMLDHEPEGAAEMLEVLFKQKEKVA